MENSNFVVKVHSKNDKRDAIILLNKLTGAKIGRAYLDNTGAILPSKDFTLHNPFLCVKRGEIDGYPASYGMTSYEYPRDLHKIVQDLISSPAEYTVEDVGDYSATINADGIEVGCQIISFEKFDEIAEKVALVRKSLQ